MHRRTQFHAASSSPTNGTTTTTTTTAHTLPTLDGGGGAAAVGGGTSTASSKEHVAVVGNFKRRRRKVKSTAFSRHYGSSLFEDDDKRCLIGLMVILLALICAGLLIIIKLLAQKQGTTRLFQSDRNNNNNIPPPMEQHQRTQRERKRNREPSDFEPLQPSDVYMIPNSMSHIGDKSDEYAELRKSFEESHPYDPERSLKATEEVRKYNFEVFENPSYDVHNCPDQPPEGYPYEWKTPVLLDHWKPDDPNPPTKIHQGLCVFDYRRDYVKAMNYRRQELPFVVRGDPDVAQAVERWTTPGYMEEMLGDVMHRAEYSENNHFMYWMPEGAGRKKHHGGPPKRPPPPGWKPPTKMIRMTYQDWVQHANVTDESLLGPDRPHWYFRLIGCGETGPQGECDSGSSEYLFDELTFFQPRPGLLYMVEPHEQKGLHCRFGMKGVIAENHFDSSRNAIAVMGGERRYILSHPKHCQNLALLPLGHPSARHSAVDWSDPDYEDFPMFANAESNEVVLQAGDVLFLPTNWFHYIISLSMNFQCNSRSGKTADYDEPIHECGF